MKRILLLISLVYTVVTTAAQVGVEANIDSIQMLIGQQAHVTLTTTAPANAKSFTIQRSAGTSTRISQVCFQIQGINTGIETVQPTDSSTQKIIREGQLLILRDGKIYTVTGQSL